ncbi:MAG: MerR family transcriptional regulator [Saprospiraceae bacterium]|nr:MerR family transcriptional regulator [Candidatus Opimibacter iunctus]
MKSIDTQNLDKLYYTIGEVAEMFEVSRSLLRYWENEFSFLTPRKNRKGDRLFTKENIQQIQIIYTLVKERGFTLEGAKQELRKEKGSLSEQVDLVDRLKSAYQRLKDLDDKLSS